MIRIDSGDCATTFCDHVRHDFEIGVQQVVAAHARLARNAGGDDHDVGVGRGRVIVGAGHAHVALLNGHGFQQVQRLALRNAFHHVNQHHIRQFLGRNPMRGRGAHVAGAHNAYFFTHDLSCDSESVVQMMREFDALSPVSTIEADAQPPRPSAH